MTTLVILTLVFIWFVLPAMLIISACKLSSMLSRAEEAAGIVVERPIGSEEPCRD